MIIKSTGISNYIGHYGKGSIAGEDKPSNAANVRRFDGYWLALIQ
jgi:hypothetical protein